MRRQTPRELAEARPVRQTPREMSRARAADQARQVEIDRQARMREQAERRMAEGAERSRQQQEELDDIYRKIEELRRLDFDRSTIFKIAKLEAERAVLEARMFSVVPPSQAQEDSIYQRNYDFTILREPQTERESYTGGGMEDQLTEREMPEAEPEAITERENYGNIMQQQNLLQLRADLSRSNAAANLNTQLANGFNTMGLRDR